MSGPKYGEALLMEKQRIELELKRKNEFIELKKELDLARHNLRDKLNELNSTRKNLSEKLSEIYDTHYRNEIQKILEETETYGIDLFEDGGNLETKIGELTKKIEKVNNQINHLNNKILEKDIEKKIDNGEVTANKKNLKLSFKTNNSLEEYYRTISLAKAEIYILHNDREKLGSICTEYENLLNSAENSDLAEIDYYNQNIKTFLFNAKKRYMAFLDLYDEYAIYSEMAGIRKREINEFSSAAELKNQIHKIKCRVERNDELAYISSVVEDVMGQFGHNILKSDVMKKNNNSELEIENTLYEFGNDSAINVMMSDGGAVMMEVVATGDDDKLSDDCRRKNVDEMKKFCGQYPEILKELENRGVLFTNREDLPPSEEFAKKVVVNKENMRKESRETNRRRRNNGCVKKSQNM